MRNQNIIQKIIKHVDTVTKYTSHITYDEFIINSMMVEACVFNLSQIGELVNRLDVEYMNMYPSIPWFKIRGLRNRIVHDYEGINFKLIWEIIDEDIKTLRNMLLKLNELSDNI